MNSVAKLRFTILKFPLNFAEFRPSVFFLFFKCYHAYWFELEPLVVLKLIDLFYRFCLFELLVIDILD